MDPELERAVWIMWRRAEPNAPGTREKLEVACTRLAQQRAGVPVVQEKLEADARWERALAFIAYMTGGLLFALGVVLCILVSPAFLILSIGGTIIAIVSVIQLRKIMARMSGARAEAVRRLATQIDAHYQDLLP